MLEMLKFHGHPATKTICKFVSIYRHFTSRLQAGPFPRFSVQKPVSRPGRQLLPHGGHWAKKKGRRDGKTGFIDQGRRGVRPEEKHITYSGDEEVFHFQLLFFVNLGGDSYGFVEAPKHLAHPS